MSEQPSAPVESRGLEAFEIRGFRTFDHLLLQDFGNVNLLVGRNNVGKTMVLEALRLHAAQGEPTAISQLLSERDEYERGKEETIRRRNPYLFRALFHGRPQEFKERPRLTLGPPDDRSRTLQISIGHLLARPGDDRSQLSFEFVDGATSGPLGLEIVFGDRRLAPIPIDEAVYYFMGSRPRARYIPDELPTQGDEAFVSARGVKGQTVAEWWDAVSLTEAEHSVVECLQIVAPIERVALVQHPLHETARVAMVKLRGEREPVPLRSLGDGLGRMFWIALAMERARERGILLIDEIENGIHYTVLPELWTFIAKAALRNQVQVFATSHSWDSIEGFQHAMVDNEDSRGVLIRLERTPQGIKPTTFSERELTIVTRDRIEVRG